MNKRVVTALRKQAGDLQTKLKANFQDRLAELDAYDKALDKVTYDQHYEALKKHMDTGGVGLWLPLNIAKRPAVRELADSFFSKTALNNYSNNVDDWESQLKGMTGRPFDKRRAKKTFKMNSNLDKALSKAYVALAESTDYGDDQIAYDRAVGKSIISDITKQYWGRQVGKYGLGAAAGVTSYLLLKDRIKNPILRWLAIGGSTLLGGLVGSGVGKSVGNALSDYYTTDLV